MKNQLLIRPGTIEDYPGFRQAEEKAWTGSGVDLITMEQYRSWLTVFPRGLLVAASSNQVAAHHFSQICNFDPDNENDNRTWAMLTDNGFCLNTHLDSGDTLYGVSISSALRGAGRAVFDAAIKQVGQLGLKRYVGACRMPGLYLYAQQKQTSIKNIVTEYTEAVVKKHLHDRTLSSLLSIPGVTFRRVVPNYFEDEQSGNWAALICYEQSR